MLLANKWRWKTKNTSSKIQLKNRRKKIIILSYTQIKYQSYSCDTRSLKWILNMKKRKETLIIKRFLRKESLNSDCQQFHQYQQKLRFVKWLIQQYLSELKLNENIFMMWNNIIYSTALKYSCSMVILFRQKVIQIYMTSVPVFVNF
jgi:hypothetical protein